MKNWAALILLGTLINDSTSVIHTLRIYETFSSQVLNCPEFVVVAVVNHIEVAHFDSWTKRAEPKQPWMNRVTEDDPEFWEWTSKVCVNHQQMAKARMERTKRHLNQTEGAHFEQVMYGCDWNDETEEVQGYERYAFDGEDFISLDLSTKTWVPAKPQAFPSKLLWEKYGDAEASKHYLEHYCPLWLKNITRYGGDTLKRTALPVVSLLLKSSSSPVTCFATGFYPDRAVLFWIKDGEELGDTGDILPNEDGTFQSSVDLDLSSVPSEDWDRFSCVFQLSGVKDDLVTKLDRDKIRTNAKKLQTSIISAVVVAGVVVIAAAVALLIVRKRRAKKSSPDVPLQQNLNPAEPEADACEDREKQKLKCEAEAETPEGH